MFRAVYSSFILFFIILCGVAKAAPQAAYVIDVRSGNKIYGANQDVRLHPASLTKMMTLYVAFEAIRRGELTLDTVVIVSPQAAAEPPSKLGLRAGNRIALRYLIRAAAVKSANDAAHAIADAVSGSVPSFAKRMNSTARAIGMKRTTFVNPHGLSANGHLSTARDMALLGRRLFYDHPEYYNLFSRITTNAGIKTVSNTNRAFLNDYPGADGIKTGYTRAAGFNLVASAHRGKKRVIVSFFGGGSVSERNRKVAQLMDYGFKKSPESVRVSRPSPIRYMTPAPKSPRMVAGYKVAMNASTRKTPKDVSQKTAKSASKQAAASKVAKASTQATEAAAPVKTASSRAKTQILARLSKTNPPRPRILEDKASKLAAAEQPKTEEAGGSQKLPHIAELNVKSPKPRDAAIALAMNKAVQNGISTKEDPMAEEIVASVKKNMLAKSLPNSKMAVAPPPRGANKTFASAKKVQRSSRSASNFGPKSWAVRLGPYKSRSVAEKELIRATLAGVETLQQGSRMVVPVNVNGATQYDGRVVGLTESDAQNACARLKTSQVNCVPILR